MHHISYVTGVESANQVEDSVVKKCLQECEDAGVKWIMHHAKFDMRVMFNKLGVLVS